MAKLETCPRKVNLTHINFAPTIHRAPYPAISPTRAELSQAGKTVLITSGSSGVCKAIARNFMLAFAAKVILVSCRIDHLKAAAAELSKDAENARSPTKFITRSCDVTKPEEITALWDDLATQGAAVDVLVLSAAKLAESYSLRELTAEEVLSLYEANVKGLLLLAKPFYKQNNDSQKVGISDLT